MTSQRIWRKIACQFVECFFVMLFQLARASAKGSCLSNVTELRRVGNFGVRKRLQCSTVVCQAVVLGPHRWGERGKNYHEVYQLMQWLVDGYDSFWPANKGYIGAVITTTMRSSGESSGTFRAANKEMQSSWGLFELDTWPTLQGKHFFECFIME